MKESQHIEWKQAWRDEYLRLVCGFAAARFVESWLHHLEKSLPDRFLKTPVETRVKAPVEVSVETRANLNKKPKEPFFEMAGLMLAKVARWLLNSPERTRGQSGGKASGVTTQVTTQKTTQIATQKILDILRVQPSLSRKALAAQLGNMTEDGVKYHLAKLKAAGLIQRIGSDRGGHWEVLE